MCKFIMFSTAVCVLFLIKLRWPRNKSLSEKYFPLVLFNKLYEMVLTVESADEIPIGDHSNEGLPSSTLPVVLGLCCTGWF